MVTTMMSVQAKLERLQQYDIDDELWETLIEMNNHPSIETMLSCAGHAQRCPKYVKRVQQNRLLYKLRDIDFEDDEEFIECFYDDYMPDVFCNGTTQPFISFKYDRQTMQPFVDALKQECPPLLVVNSLIKIIDDNLGHIDFGYGNGDEGYSPSYYRYDHWTGNHQFDRFWKHIQTCWSKYVQSTPELPIPENFTLVTSYCRHDKKRKRDDEGEQNEQNEQTLLSTNTKKQKKCKYEVMEEEWKRKPDRLSYLDLCTNLNDIELSLWKRKLFCCEFPKYSGPIKQPLFVE